MVREVEKPRNSLAETRKDVTRLIRENKGEEYDFDARLREANEEVRKASQEAYAKNRRQTILAYNELYCLRNNLGASGYHLPISSR